MKRINLEGGQMVLTWLLAVRQITAGSLSPGIVSHHPLKWFMGQWVFLAVFQLLCISTLILFCLCFQSPPLSYFQVTLVMEASFLWSAEVVFGLCPVHLLDLLIKYKAPSSCVKLADAEERISVLNFTGDLPQASVELVGINSSSGARDTPWTWHFSLCRVKLSFFTCCRVTTLRKKVILRAVKSNKE